MMGAVLLAVWLSLGRPHVINCVLPGPVPRELSYSKATATILQICELPMNPTDVASPRLKKGADGIWSRPTGLGGSRNAEEETDGG